MTLFIFAKKKFCTPVKNKFIFSLVIYLCFRKQIIVVNVSIINFLHNFLIILALSKLLGTP